ncbi:hypothetical protein AAFN86_01480 [Roseomonas sp. CAU 1739]
MKQITARSRWWDGWAAGALRSCRVGATPEGIQVSPDNRHVAVTIHDGSARPEGDPLRGTR